MGRMLLTVVRVVLLAVFLLTGLAGPTVNVSLVALWDSGVGEKPSWPMHLPALLSACAWRPWLG